MKNLYLLPALLTIVFTSNFAIAEDELEYEFNTEGVVGTGIGGAITTGGVVTLHKIGKNDIEAKSKLDALLIDHDATRNAAVKKSALMKNALDRYISEDPEVKRTLAAAQDIENKISLSYTQIRSNSIAHHAQKSALIKEQQKIAERLILAQKIANLKWNALHPEFKKELALAMKTEFVAGSAYESVVKDLKNLHFTSNLITGATTAGTLGGVAIMYGGLLHIASPKVIDSSNFTMKSEASGFLGNDAFEQVSKEYADIAN